MDKQYCAAPMEGLTTWLWRRVHRDIFGGADKYYTPFLSPNANLSFQTKERREIEHNEGLPVVPQLLAARADHLIWAARALGDMGYEEVNLNFGCPSGTVAAKGKGAGMLTDPAVLDRCLEAVFSALPGMKISVKTRIGRHGDGEWPALLAVYDRYPIHALIVHPRVQKDFYKGTARRAVFAWTRAHTHLPLVYNGDIVTPEDAAGWDVPVMVGRGLMADPALLRRARGGAPASRDELGRYLDALAEGYAAAIGDEPAARKLWELWAYLAGRFAGAEGALKKMRKCRSLADCRPIVRDVLEGCKLAWE